MMRIEETSTTLRNRFTKADKAKFLLDAIDILLSDMGYEAEYTIDCFEGGDTRYRLWADIYDRGKPRRSKK